MREWIQEIWEVVEEIPDAKSSLFRDMLAEMPSKRLTESAMECAVRQLPIVDESEEKVARMDDPCMLVK